MTLALTTLNALLSAARGLVKALSLLIVLLMFMAMNMVVTMSKSMFVVMITAMTSSNRRHLHLDPFRNIRHDLLRSKHPIRIQSRIAIVRRDTGQLIVVRMQHE
jgi:hypothetical protein